MYMYAVQFTLCILFYIFNYKYIILKYLRHDYSAKTSICNIYKGKYNSCKMINKSKYYP